MKTLCTLIQKRNDNMKMDQIIYKTLLKLEYLFGDISHRTDRIRIYFKGLRWRLLDDK
jgi:hypothetical protein